MADISELTDEVSRGHSLLARVVAFLAVLLLIAIAYIGLFRPYQLHTGGPMPTLEGCRMYAWVFAANGIAIESKAGEEHSVVFVGRISEDQHRGVIVGI